MRSFTHLTDFRNFFRAYVNFNRDTITNRYARVVGNGNKMLQYAQVTIKLRKEKPKKIFRVFCFPEKSTSF